MFIQIEETPNPRTLKFLPGVTVYEQGTAEFSSKEGLGEDTIITKLLNVSGVTSIFLGHDFISITKRDEDDWIIMKPSILALMMEYFVAGQPIVINEAQIGGIATLRVGSEVDQEIAKQIQEILDQKVRPAVAQDGGDIVFSAYEDGIVYVKMKGACAGCPSSTLTLKAGIENMLRHYLPEIKEVREG